MPCERHELGVCSVYTLSLKATKGTMAKGSVLQSVLPTQSSYKKPYASLIIMSFLLIVQQLAPLWAKVRQRPYKRDATQGP